VQLQYNSSVCKLTSFSPNTLPVYSGFLVHFLRTSSLTTSLYSEICNHLTTGDWGITHKLKPRLFIKLYSALTSFTFHWILLLEFTLLLSNILLQRSVLLCSREYSYLLLCSFVLRSFVFDIYYLYNFYLACVLPIILHMIVLLWLK